MAVRLKDIASDLNLSKMTISKVLRGQTDVSAATKARVLKRVQELNYRPNVTARSLRTGQTRSAGLVVGSLAHPTVARIAAGLNEVLREAGYGLVISSADRGAEMFAHETELHLSRQVDVLFLLLEHFPGQESVADVEAGGEAPRIYLGPHAEAAGRTGNVFTVGCREKAVGRAAARHLAQGGCERVGCLRGPRTPGYDERFAGFLHAARLNGMTLRQEWVLAGELGEGEYQSGLQAGRRWFGGAAAPDGVSTCTDLQACGVRDAAREAGLGVPEQVQILGSGNRVELCEMGAGLSSVDYALEETGQQAARLGLAVIAKRAARAAGTIVPKVAQRASTLGARAGQARESGLQRAGAGGR